MIRTKAQNEPLPTEPQTGRPAATAEQWLGHNRSTKRRLWERLNPRNKKQVRLIAEALSLQQTHGCLPDALRARLSGVAEEVERIAGRINALLAEIDRKTPPQPRRFPNVSKTSNPDARTGNRAGNSSFEDIAPRLRRSHTSTMAVSTRQRFLTIALLASTASLGAFSARADEIRLKDGKKFNGEIVAYEDNMFKIKTDYGFVMVEKDKIASIVPSAIPATKAQPAGKKEAAPVAVKPGADVQPATAVESSITTAAGTSGELTNASSKSVIPTAAEKHATQTPKIANAAVKPEIPASITEKPTAPAIGGPKVTATSALVASSAPAAPPKPEAPANREEIQGNLYTNYTHGFRMFKAPSWNLLDDARKALPNAIVALGTSNESTLVVVGQEKTKEPLDTAATTVEKRLREIYTNYRQISQKKAVVGGLPAVEFHYRGLADEHDWSGTLVVVSRGSEILTILGMTYADSDLIQIQENVIAKAITSMDFSVR